jgi:glycosyltransferase involved in cell wall biosynthesis
MKPYISIVVPTTRIGGLDILFSGLETQTFKNFELILVDGLYDRRKDLVAEKAKQYSFTVKHIPQPDTATTFSLALNLGFTNAEGYVVYVLPDYTWIRSDCLQIHADFHRTYQKPNEKFALIGYFHDCALPALNKDFYRTYASPNEPFYREKPNKFLEKERENYNNYIEDLNAGKLNSMMWSLFETPFTSAVDPNTFQVTITKEQTSEGFVDGRKCIFKNESYLLETILDINGANEALDGSHGWADWEFADRLIATTSTQLYHRPDAVVYTINPRNIMYGRLRDRGVFSNEAIWEAGVKAGFKDPVNTYSLREKRNTILATKTEKPKAPMIHSTKKPYLSIVCPTMRIGGLDTLFNSLEQSTFKEFELIISDSLYQYRKDIVKDKAKGYTFRYKHIAPINDKFPTFSHSHSTNSAIVQAEGDVIVFVTDYRYFTPQSLQKHADFHRSHADNVGYAPGSKFLLPAPMKNGLPSYGRNDNYMQYVEDLKSGKLQDFMWSIFENDPFSKNPDLSTWPEIDRLKIGYDPKTVIPYGTEVHPQQIYLQSESVKTKIVLEANGMNESLDGAFNYMDNEFSYRLRNLFDFKWIGDNTNIIYRITGGDWIINKARILEEAQNNAEAIFRKCEAGSKEPVNTWSLASVHTTNQAKRSMNGQSSHPVQLPRAEKPMKIAFLFGAWSIGARPLDFNCLWSSPRGLTGSDLGVAITAKEMAKLGHDVSLFTVHGANKPDVWEGVKLYHIGEKDALITNDFDAVISWSEPDILRNLPAKPVKVVCMMLNDFTYCQPGYDNAVDVWTAPCQMLIDHLVAKPDAPPRNKFVVLPLGCEPSWYSDKRVPGRVIWASSADRGLHLLLQEWPKIKAAVPNADLRIFYNFNYSSVEGMEPNSNNHPHFLELGHRARYMKETIKRLGPLGVEQMGSVSRDRIQEEMSLASVLAFPCDTVAWTEGFSVTALEAHASYTVPVIGDTDCLGSVYCNSGALMIPRPVKQHMPVFVDHVVKALTDKAFADEVIAKCQVFAADHTWARQTQRLETIIKDRLR